MACGCYLHFLSWVRFFVEPNMWSSFCFVLFCSIIVLYSKNWQHTFTAENFHKLYSSFFDQPPNFTATVCTVDNYWVCTVDNYCALMKNLTCHADGGLAVLYFSMYLYRRFRLAAMQARKIKHSYWMYNCLHPHTQKNTCKSKIHNSVSLSFNHCDKVHSEWLVLTHWEL